MISPLTALSKGVAWLRNHWRLQLAALGVCVIIALAGVWLPYATLAPTVAAGHKSALSGQRQATNYLGVYSGLDSPSAVQPGVFGSARRLADAAQAATQANRPQAIPSVRHIFYLQPYPSMAAGKSLATANRLSTGDNQAIAKINQHLPQAYSDLEYHAATAKALVNILEYNPAIDFASFEPNGKDTLLRLEKAKSGLAATLTALTAARSLPHSADPTATDLYTQVEYLQNSLAELSKTGDVSVWSARVGSTQRTIIENRDRYWQERLKYYRDILIPARDRLGRSVDAWQGLGRTIGLNTNEPY